MINDDDNKLCIFNDCFMTAEYNFRGHHTPSYCHMHKLNIMINVNHKS